jgi:hypothetical protein
MGFLKVVNINLTQNNIHTSAPSPHENDIIAYIDVRTGDINAHLTSKFTAGVEEDTNFPARETP